MYYGRDLNIMSLGQRSSDSLGVDTAKVRKILLITASLLAAACVSVSGIIGFIGLIVPHLMRSLVGPDNRKLIFVSMLAGAILLLAADTLSRAILPAEVPVGVERHDVVVNTHDLSGFLPLESSFGCCMSCGTGDAGTAGVAFGPARSAPSVGLGVQARSFGGP